MVYLLFVEYIIYMSASSSVKTVIMPNKVSTKKSPPKKRIITTSSKWNFQVSDLSLEYQLELLRNCFVERNGVPPSERVLFLEQLIHSKWYGYRTQDHDKTLFDEVQFVSEREISELLIKCNLNCFYCRKPIQLFYEYVREPLQWTVERIDNAFGHNRGNVEIACLRCNIRRRTMYHERFIMTKQMTITKMEGLTPRKT